MRLRTTCVVSLLLFLAAGRAYAQDERDPLTIVQETNAHILQVLESNREEFTQNPGKLRAMVREDLLPLIDLRYSARLILGRAGRGVSPQQLEAFSNAMSSVLINGIAAEYVSVFDRGLHYGDGLFETIACIGGRPVFIEQHLERMQRGADLLDIPFPDEHFDLAWACLVLHWLAPDDVERAMSELLRVLRPGGWVVCAEPDGVGTN